MVNGCVRQVVVLYSNDYMGTGLGRLSLGCLRRVAASQMWLYKQVLLYFSCCLKVVSATFLLVYFVCLE